MSKTEVAEERISADEMRDKLQSFQDGLQHRVEDSKNTLLAVGSGVLIVMLIVFFLLGKRAGKKKTTLVEIRRI
jgi:hypothetical protein